MEQKRAVSTKLAAKYRGCRQRKQRSQIPHQVVELTGYFDTAPLGCFETSAKSTCPAP
ncbi:MAG: hypothetical protein ABSG17_24230 [Spirochaetia bacterium]